MDVNFLPCVHDQRSLLPPAWQDWLPRGGSGLFILDAVVRRGAQRMHFGCSPGSEMHSYRTAPNHL